MCVQYIGGCSVHRGDTMSTSGGCSVHRRDTMSTSGGCSVHRRDTMSTSGGYHEYIGGCSVHRRDIMIHVEKQLHKILSISIENSNVLNIPRCTHDIPPMYSRYPPDVLMVSPRCTEHPPMYSWYPPTCIMISPRCTHGIPTMY